MGGAAAPPPPPPPPPNAMVDPPLAVIYHSRLVCCFVRTFLACSSKGTLFICCAKIKHTNTVTFYESFETNLYTEAWSTTEHLHAYRSTSASLVMCCNFLFPINGKKKEASIKSVCTLFQAEAQVLACIKNTNSKNTPSSIDVLAIALTRVTFSFQFKRPMVKALGRKLHTHPRLLAMLKALDKLLLLLLLLVVASHL